MPQTPETSIALYRAEQVEAYEQAKDRLERQGELPESPAEGDYLQALAEQYVTDESGETAAQSPRLWPFVKLGVGVVGVLAALAVVLLGFAFGLMELGIM